LRSRDLAACDDQQDAEKDEYYTGS
jgi:hypothetical protein